jgi:hypothetical protein
MQALYLLALFPVAATTADPDSYGFRTERSTVTPSRSASVRSPKRAAHDGILRATSVAASTTSVTQSARRLVSSPRRP